ncbi:MAG: TonB-dependent receptor [Ginsengibacter sp.]
MRIVFCIIFSFPAIVLHAQYKQQLRGSVTDIVLQKPLAAATVSIMSLGKSVVTGEDGSFRFINLPVGSYQLTISYSGFKETVLDNVAVNAGKETILSISLEPLVHEEKEVVLKVDNKKNKPLNDMSAVSARAFTVEETQRYAASVNDPLRMATVFPGVFAPDDGNNNITIRGNSPAGLLWKMEGMEIPNPNHFSSAGSSGGGISILSSQLLANSDFVTSAFAAEYGNALSGVFDLKLRKGNNEKKEYTLQAGFLGLNVAAEGPFSKSYKGSYLVNYRYSTLGLLNKIGVLPDEANTNFQDLSYNIFLPAGKAGTFTLFGFGGLSKESRKTILDSSKWTSLDDRYPYISLSNTGMAGLTHTILLGNNINLKSGIGISYSRNGYDEKFVEDDYSQSRTYKDNSVTKKWLLNTTLNYRLSNQLNLRAGVIVDLIKFNYYQQSREHGISSLPEMINSKESTSTQEAFAQWQYKPTNEFTLSAGLHFLHLALNNTSSLEPRASAKWNINNRSSIAAGYGLHSQLQPLGIYFAQLKNVNGSLSFPNKDLSFTKSHHYVLSYSYRLNRNLLVKTELYYQKLFNVPVSTIDSSTFSVLNVEEDYVTDLLVNKGSGRNYGLEISIERYLRNNFYFMLSNSLYQSKYTAADKIERNTRFNGNYITTLISGKDFVYAHNSKTFGINIKIIYAGGLRNTPIDLVASRQKGYTVFKEKDAYSFQNPSYFRTDLRVSMKWNRKHFTSTLSLDIQDVTNRLNIYNQWYDYNSDKIINNYQTGLIPVLNYKIDF